MDAAEFHEHVRREVIASIDLERVRALPGVRDAAFHKHTDDGVTFTVELDEDVYVLYQVAITGQVVSGGVNRDTNERG